MPDSDGSPAASATPPALCRDCGAETTPPRCTACGSPRIVAHPELLELSLAHLDCDAFYAAIEKRDRPELRDKPLLIGGGRRGVVSTCCYLARTRGVHSAMPMYRARQLCPTAVVLRPDMAKYRAESRRVRALMDDLTPLVEAISIDEAFLDLAGTERLHGHAPAVTLIELARRVEREVGITVSIGLSYNKFLAKVASDLEKPRGFAVIGRSDATAFLEDKPVSLIWGVGRALERKLKRDGVTRVGQLRQIEETELLRRYGSIGARLARFSRGEDARTVTPHQPAKSISSERTFDRDIADYSELERRLWPMCEAVSKSLKAKGLAGGVVTLKLKTSGHRLVSRSGKLSGPTQLAGVLFERGTELLRKETGATRYRLLGIGASDLVAGDLADQPDLADPGRRKMAAGERAVDSLRQKFGDGAIGKGRGLS